MLVTRKIGELRVSELRAELEKRSLDSKGLKSSLLQRLQKAILDEGGDVEQIEVDINTGASPFNKKTSQRIKRLTEQVAEVEDESNADMKVTTALELDKEKSDHANDGNREGTEAGMAEGDQSDLEEKEKETKDHSLLIAEETGSDSGKPVTNDSMFDEDDLVVKDEIIDDDNPSEDAAVEEGFLKEEIDLEQAETTATSADENHKDVVETQSEEDIATDHETSHGIDDLEENQLNDDGNETVYDNDEAIKPADEGVDQSDDYETIKPSDDFGAKKPGDNGSVDDGADDDEADKLNDSDKMDKPHGNDDDAADTHDGDDDDATDTHDGDDDDALEDDVLDMLDYDIEMPENAQVENFDEAHGSNDEGVAKTSDEGGNKDTSMASQSGKDGKETSEDEKVLKNLWITGLSASTRASELKIAFSRYGKVVGAKVVTNARSPGAKCYGFVAMATSDAAKKCIIHLHKTDLHGRLITVEYTKNDPSARKNAQDNIEADEKGSQPSDNSPAKDTPSSRRSTGNGSKGAAADDSQIKRTNSDSNSKFRRTESSRLGEKRTRKSPLGVRERDGARVFRRPSDGKREITGEPYRKRTRTIGERKVMIDNQRGGLSLRVNVRPAQEGRRPNVLRRTSPLRTARADERFTRRPDGRSLAHDNARARSRDMREREMRDRDAREEISRRRATSERSGKSMAMQASIERDRIMLRKEKEERNFLRMEREKLERERRQLERDRIERERLEQERIKLEHERKRELEKIEREKEEMKRLQEINRFEQSQRQRALKRMYDGRAHDERGDDAKRGDRDDRRRYDGDRHAAPMLSFRDEEGGYRTRGGAPGRMEKVNYHDVDRRNMSHNDTDARYSGGRRVEKYERSKGGDYDRRGADNISGNMSYRHHEKNVNDDRKVVSRDRGRPAGGSNYRRDESSLSKKEPVSSLRGSTGSGRMRATDRDLREEIRQGPLSGTARKGSPHLGDLRLRDEPPLGRNAPRGATEAPKYQERAHPEPPMHINTSLPSAPASGKPIPTTGRSGMAFPPSNAWPAWQHNERGEAGAVWHGPGPVPGGGAPVGRIVAPMGMPFNPMTSVNPPLSIGGDPAMMGHGIPDTFAQSRMDSTYKPPRRF